MDTIVVIDPEGKPGVMPARNLKKALKWGFKIANPAENIAIIDPEGKKGLVPKDNLQKAIEWGFRPADPSKTDVAKHYGQGVAEGVGGLTDTFNKYVQAPIMVGAATVAGGVSKGVSAVESMVRDDGKSPIGDSIRENIQQPMVRQENEWANSNLKETLPKSEFLKPESIIQDNDTRIAHAAGAITEEAGEWITGTKILSLANKTLNVTKNGTKVAAPWLDKINKFLATDTTATRTTAQFTAGAGVAESLKNPNDNETMKIVKDLGGFMLGGTVVDFAKPATVAASKQISKVVLDAVEYAKNPSLEGFRNLFPDFIAHPINKSYETALKLTTKITGATNKLDETTIKAMQEMGIELNASTIYDKNNSSVIIANLLPNQIYKDTIKNIDKKTIKYIEDFLDTNLGAVQYGGTLGEKIRSVSNKIEFDIKQMKDNLDGLKQAAYNRRDNALVPTDTVKTQYIIKTAQDIIKKTEGFDNPSGSKAKMHAMASKIISELSEKPEIHPLILLNKKTDLNEFIAKADLIGDSRKMAIGIKDEITNSLKIANDSGAIANKDFFKLAEQADAFYKEEYAPLLKLDVSKSLLSGSSPDELFKIAETHDGLHKALKTLKEMDTTTTTTTTTTKAKNKKITKNVIDDFVNKKIIGDSINELLPISDGFLKDILNMTKAEIQQGMSSVINESIKQEEIKKELISGPFRRLIAQKYLIEKNINVDGSLDYKKIINIFSDVDKSTYLRDALNENKHSILFNKLKENVVPLAEKMLQIENKIANTPMNDINKIVDIGTFAAGSKLGGGPLTPLGMTTGAMALGTKILLGRAWAKAATDPKLVNRLIELSRKESEKETINFLVNIINRSFKANQAFKGHIVTDVAGNIKDDTKEKYNNTKKYLKNNKEKIKNWAKKESESMKESIRKGEFAY
jgi:hypothetical protein